METKFEGEQMGVGHQEYEIGNGRFEMPIR
jgi:hypothetical protein